MNASLTKEEILSIASEIPHGIEKEDVFLCLIIAVGQILRYGKKHEKTETSSLDESTREDIKKKLRGCFKKCGLAKKQLRKCIVNAIDAGLTTDEILALTDDIVGGLGKKHNGVDVHDRFSAYKTLAKKTKNPQQDCWTHIINNSKELAQFYGEEGKHIHQVLKKTYKFFFV